MQPIMTIAKTLGLGEDDIKQYGKYKAKLSWDKIKDLGQEENGKLILVTAISPTPAGEGKSTMTVGLGDSLAKIGKKTMIALREPSMGPTMGMRAELQVVVMRKFSQWKKLIFILLAICTPLQQQIMP